jgi:hypothetical protein
VTDSREEEMSCEEFQSLLPAMIETGKDAHGHPHVRGCNLCSSLVVDLERIAEESRKYKPDKRGEGSEDGTDPFRSR